MPGPVSRPHALVADDDPAMRALLSELLRAEGLDVSEAADGRELFWGLERAASGGPALDLLLSDVRMPGYSGLSVLEALRDVDGPPAILMTAFPDGDVRRRAAKLGVVLLEKPFDLAALLRLVHQMVPGKPDSRRRSSSR